MIWMLRQKKWFWRQKNTEYELRFVDKDMKNDETEWELKYLTSLLPFDESIKIYFLIYSII